LPTGERVVTPAERLKRRLVATGHANAIVERLRERFPGVPLEVELEIIKPFGEIQAVDGEDGSVIIRTDGSAVLAVQAVANDLARDVQARDAVELVPRVWPRTIWCRKSPRQVPADQRVPAGTAAEPALLAERDERGNTRLCLRGSHAGDHDFPE
jgi:hypothetical protein